MSLKTIHLVFITCSILLTEGFAYWCFQMGGEPNPYRWAGVSSMLIGLGMVGYAYWFVKKYFLPRAS